MKSIKYVVFSCAVLALLVVGCDTTEMAQEAIDTYVGPIHFQDHGLLPKS